jgi:hypothetical protein
MFHAAGWSADPVATPGGGAAFTPPPGWLRLDREGATWRAPRDAGSAARIALSTSAGSPAEAAAELRDGWRRVASAEMLDEDDVPAGGRTWRRLHARVAAGPLIFAQCAWIGTVGGRTLVIVASAPDALPPAALAAADGVLGSLSAPRPAAAAAP